MLCGKMKDKDFRRSLVSYRILYSSVHTALHQNNQPVNKKKKKDSKMTKTNKQTNNKQTKTERKNIMQLNLQALKAFANTRKNNKNKIILVNR